jgi:hypothetical protein
MKKIISLMLILSLFGMISASAQIIPIEKTLHTQDQGNTGDFLGEIGFIRNQQWNKVGELSGTYNQNRIVRINGNWIITEGEYAGTSGTMRGIIFRNFIFFRASVDSGRTLPFIGFIRINEDESTFGGRFMSFVGPALYFKGTYT